MLADSLRLAAAIEEKAVIYRCLDGLGAVSLAIGDLERAAKLVGAAEAVADASGAFLDPSERALHEQTASALQRDLAPESLRVASLSGRAMTLDDAITYALVQVPQRAALDRSA